jgi:iron(II)-dependent oxidoreductase
MINDLSTFPRATLQAWTIDARDRTLSLVGDLSDDEFLHPPLLRTINPFLWEIGHVGYFQEYWVLRHAAGHLPMLADADAWYDSAKVAHDIRWDLPLPSRRATIEYIERVRDNVLDRIAKSDLNHRDVYFMLLSIFHEDMHNEALIITRQTLGYAAPAIPVTPQTHQTCQDSSSSQSTMRYMTVPAGKYIVGSRPGPGFIFDNEKWAHEVSLRAFQIARAPVTQSEYFTFVQDEGYTRREFWGDESWAWRDREQITHPTYWKREADAGWLRRHFDRWIPLEPHIPVANISWYEAQAYCRWAGLRLPTEFEWEAAAGEVLAGPSANLETIGNVWEWTASDFLPYPGFSADPYKEYSEPWFGTHKTLRGGAWSTRSRLMKPSYRNFYMPDRRDLWAGFRTCALES